MAQTNDLTIEELRQDRDERKLHPSHELVFISAGELVSLYDQLIDTMQREQKLRKALTNIATVPDEENEWDAVEKFNRCRVIARDAVNQDARND